jgi:predicted methyltransferase
MRVLFLILIFLSCSRKIYHREQALPGSLEEATNSLFRPEENTDRDEFQHPVETLKFFGIKPKMTVVEITPGAGYFTEIIAPYLAKDGQYYIAYTRMSSKTAAIAKENEKKLQDILLRSHDVQTKTRFIAFEPIDKKKQKMNFADMVVSFNSVHNWVGSNTVAKSFKFFYDVLKPGGTLGIVQHRIAPNKVNRPKSGYLTEDSVIAMAKRAGLKFVGKSEINANPKDSGDHTGGVWALPPYYRNGKADYDKYKRIGESDRMTLKFTR